MELNKLLSTHDLLLETLITIPQERKMVLRIDEIDNQRIAKPRFSPPSYNLPISIRKQLSDYIGNLKDFFNLRDYKIRENLELIFDPALLHEHKNSPIFLLERDTWATDTVYGDYLIEGVDEDITVFYQRRRQKRNQVGIDWNDLENGIKLDAVNQITTEFAYLWNQLKHEIIIADTFFKSQLKKISNAFLVEQFEGSKNLTEVNPIAAGLILGRILEMMCQKLLKKRGRSKLSSNIAELRVKEIFSQDEINICESIRTEYNWLKHDLLYNVNPVLVKDLWERFEPILRKNFQR